MRANNIEEFFGTLQQSTVEIWKEHLKTNKYSTHIALNEFYDEIVELVDKLIENYIGLHGEVSNYTNVLTSEDPIKYLEELRDFVRDGAKAFCKESELKSDVDDILSLIDSTLYKLKNLTESKVMDLKDFLNESLNESNSIVEIDSLNNTQWMKFISSVHNVCKTISRDDITMAMKMLAGENLKLSIDRFYSVKDSIGDEFLAYKFDDGDKYFDVDWFDIKELN